MEKPRVLKSKYCETEKKWKGKYYKSLKLPALISLKETCTKGETKLISEKNLH